MLRTKLWAVELKLLNVNRNNSYKRKYFAVKGNYFQHREIAFVKGYNFTKKEIIPGVRK